MPIETGYLTCGICGKTLVQAQWIPAFVCPDNKCRNSEENFND